jgi:hypothetical protein
MSNNPVGHGHSQSTALELDKVVLPARAQMLIESLRDPALQWRSSHTQGREAWESDRGVDPTRPVLETDYPSSRRGHSTSVRGGSFGPRPHAHVDWHTTDSVVLASSTDLYEVILRKTHVNSYSHRTRTGVDKTWYSAEFRSLNGERDTVTSNDSECPILARVFEDISRKVH